MDTPREEQKRNDETMHAQRPSERLPDRTTPTGPTDTPVSASPVNTQTAAEREPQKDQKPRQQYPSPTVGKSYLPSKGHSDPASPPRITKSHHPSHRRTTHNTTIKKPAGRGHPLTQGTAGGGRGGGGGTHRPPCLSNPTNGTANQLPPTPNPTSERGGPSTCNGGARMPILPTQSQTTHLQTPIQDTSPLATPTPHSPCAGQKPSPTGGGPAQNARQDNPDAKNINTRNNRTTYPQLSPRESPESTLDPVSQDNPMRHTRVTAPRYRRTLRPTNAPQNKHNERSPKTPAAPLHNIKPESSTVPGGGAPTPMTHTKQSSPTTT
ncbi:unnamed protein product [Dicrocoelium dendriticum]|nr:unnamed protein product [Dicrocoelium dendriticum]